MKAIIVYPARARGALILGFVALVLFAPRAITIVSTTRVKVPQNLSFSSAESIIPKNVKQLH